MSIVNNDLVTRGINQITQDASRVISDCVILNITDSGTVDSGKYDYLNVRETGWFHDLMIEIPANSLPVGVELDCVMLDFVTEIPASGKAVTRTGKIRPISARVTSLKNIFAIAKIKTSAGDFLASCQAKIYAERVGNLKVEKWATGGFKTETVAIDELPDF